MTVFHIWLIQANNTHIAGGGERYSLTSRYTDCRDISHMATHIAEMRIAIRILQEQESVLYSSLKMQACKHTRRHNDIHTQHATRNTQHDLRCCRVTSHFQSYTSWDSLVGTEQVWGGSFCKLYFLPFFLPVSHTDSASEADCLCDRVRQRRGLYRRPHAQLHTGPERGREGGGGGERE